MCRLDRYGHKTIMRSIMYGDTAPKTRRISPAWLLSWLFVALTMPIASGARAEAAPASAETAAIIGRARDLRKSGHGSTAIELLKRARKLAPDDEALAVFLAWTYWAQGNRVWALRTAVEFTQSHALACDARTASIWFYVQLADLAQAEALLSEPGCEELPEDRARFALLRVALARQLNRPVADQVARAQSGRLYPEDAPLLEELLERNEPGRLPLVTTRLDLAAGWTSNGLAGSPVDVTSPVGDRGSAVVAVDGRARVVYPALRAVRPVVSAQLKLFELFGSAARDLSYEQPTFRAGLLLGTTAPTLLVSYALDAVRLQAGDRYAEGPMWFSEAHRIEWEARFGAHWMYFGGSGYRWFRDMARSRADIEQGLISSWSVGPRLELLVAFSGRWQRAHADAYNLIGGTAISELNWALGAGTNFRWTLSASADYYPDSRNYFPRSAAARRDLLERSVTGVWYTVAPNWQVVPSYELTTRASTSEPYSFVDHRVLVRIVWNFDTNQYALVDRESRIPAEWSDRRRNRARDDARIQDLVRQDDSVKRGSSCLK